ncbi:MAG TPA: peptidoglycan-associated lipoprotein Pal [Polyangia bacterium]
MPNLARQGSAQSRPDHSRRNTCPSGETTRDAAVFAVGAAGGTSLSAMLLQRSVTPHNPNHNGLGPATSKRTIKSVVTVRDQQSIVLGGLIKDSVSSTVQGVPVLDDIPILGYLFKSVKRTISKENRRLRAANGRQHRRAGRTEVFGKRPHRRTAFVFFPRRARVTAFYGRSGRNGLCNGYNSFGGPIMRSVALVPLLLVFGCAHKQETKAATPPPASAPATTSTAPAQPAESTCSSDLDCGAKQLCIRNRCVDITAGLAECSSVRVHFPFNSSEIDPADKPGLERSARCLKADQQLHVTVAGNADERGTEEYNMALGDKRATAVAAYLESLGASAAQLKTVSYGKENPLCAEHDEECWAKNRRAEMKNSESAKPKKGRK